MKEHAIVFCLVTFQEINVLLGNVYNLVVDILSMMSLIYSKRPRKNGDAMIDGPWRYLRRNFNSWEWISAGPCMLWHNLLLEKAMSGLVRVRYCNDPTNIQYCEVVKISENFGGRIEGSITIEVEVGLQLIIHAH